MKEFYRNLGMNVFMVSYRGYGKSQGTPTEEGLQRDGQAVIDHVWGRGDVDKTRILVLGRSLGGAVSVYVCEQNPDKVKGLILENTFTSIPDMVDVVMPWVAPLKSLVLRIGWQSVERIPSITTPILFISGRSDELIPPAQMDQLQAAAKSSIYTTMHQVTECTMYQQCFLVRRDDSRLAHGAIAHGAINPGAGWHAQRHVDEKHSCLQRSRKSFHGQNRGRWCGGLSCLIASSAPSLLGTLRRRTILQ